MKSTFFSDFKAFISKGNIVDMAVGVVIGGAFGKIVTSLVSDIITPLISLLTGKANLSEMYACLNPSHLAALVEGGEGVTFEAVNYPTVAAAQAAGYATLNYGAFIQSIIDFLIIAFSIFLVLRIIMKSKEKLEALTKKKEEEATAAEEPAAPAGPTSEELLTEIRDLLKEKQ